MLSNSSPSHRQSSNLQLEEQNPLSYSAMVADIDLQEHKSEQGHAEVPIQQSKCPSARSNPFNQEKNFVQKNTESTKPSNINHQYKVPYQLTTKRTQPEHSQAPISKNKAIDVKPKNVPKFPPLSPRNIQQVPGARNQHVPLAIDRRNSSPIKNAPKSLGKIIKSNIIRNKNPIHCNIEEVSDGSCLVNESKESSSLSHFDPVYYDDDEEEEEEKSPSNEEYVIKTSQIPNKNSSFSPGFGKCDTPIAFQESRVKDFPKQEMKKQNRFLENPPECNEAMLTSVIIKKTSISESKKPLNKEGVSVQREDWIDLPQEKEPDFQMKLTYDPKKKQSAFKNAQNGGNFSEPDKRSSTKPSKPVNNNMLLNFEESEENSQRKVNKFEEVIHSRLNQLMGMLQHLPVKDNESIQNQLASALREEIHQKSSKTKIEDIRQIVPQDFLNGFSSVDLRDKKNKIPSKQFNNYHSDVNLQIKRVKSKVKEIQRRHMGEQQHSRGFRKFSKPSSQFSINFIDERERHSSRLNGLACEKQIELTSSDESLEELDKSMLKLPRTPTPNDTPQNLTDSGIKVFEKLGIRAKDYKSMDLNCDSQGVLFQLHKGPSINWEYSGRLLFSQARKKGRHRSSSGIEIIPGRSIYKGEIFRNMKDGYGVNVWKNGEKYKGFWKNDKFHGKGKFVTKKSIFQGNFLGGLKFGLGNEEFANGDDYEGDYQEDKFHGRGKYFWKNGTVYKGDFKNHQMEGEGFWQSPNGDTYEGEYSHSNKHGFGVYQCSDGRVYEGRFEQGKIVRTKNQARGTIPVERELSDFTGEYQDRYQVKLGPKEKKKRYTIQNLSSYGSLKKLPKSGYTYRM